MSDPTRITPCVDRITLVGLVLLLAPLLTMAHELVGHAVACVSLGYAPSQLGAFYVECPGTSALDARLVAMAGTGVDVLLALLAYAAWRLVKRPLPRLALWIVFAEKSMVAAGYWLFSGVSGFGDWGPGTGGAIGPLPQPWLWRIGLAVVGGGAYFLVTRLAIRMLGQILGGGLAAQRTQRQIAMSVYLVGGLVAVLVGLLNPLGIVITLLSAMASSFGGTAGLFNVAFVPPRTTPPADFVIGRHYAVFALGIAVTVAFAAVLGPTVYLH